MNKQTVVCNRRLERKPSLPHQLRRMKKDKKFQDSLRERTQSFFQRQNTLQKNIKHTNRIENIKTIYGCTYSEYICLWQMAQQKTF